METVKELSNFRGPACLVKHAGNYYVVSSADVPFSGPETLVFPADESGEVTSWTEVAGGRRMTREEAMADLAENA